MKINYPETILKKSQGLNAAESYLAKLCNETFLSLWSYPNLFRNQGRTNSSRQEGKGGGKELCDLLVIFENHIIIFSDKKCVFSNSGDLLRDWSRWYKRAVLGSAKQIWGAERWIKQFPDRIFLDSNCTQPFPIKLPLMEQAIIHRIVVAHGASKECINHLGGTGSLIIFPSIIGDMHMLTEYNRGSPFAIGQVNPSKGYIHIFDDTSLQVVMETLDTVSDFTQYLVKKEELIISGKLLSASGEDDLLGYYLKNVDENNQHTFFPEPNETDGAFVITEGLWAEFSQSHMRMEQIKANEISYSWDMLIEKFLHHITTGTSYRLSHPNITSQEEIFKFLAKENRTRRRLLARAIHELIAKTPENHRSTRLIFPSSPGEPHYLFFLLPRSNGISEEEYREIRGRLLESHLMILKHNYPQAKDIIGLATEAGLPENRSEDLIYLDASEWTEELEQEAKELEKEFIAQGFLGKRSMFRSIIKEYPDDRPEKIFVGMKGRERNMRCPCNSGKKYKKCCGAEH